MLDAADLPPLHPALRGGVPRRSMAPGVIDAMLHLEEASIPQNDSSCLMISLDASKCFDRIRGSFAINLAREHGVPDRHA